jgi:hypothetical protein
MYQFAKKELEEKSDFLPDRVTTASYHFSLSRERLRVRVEIAE